jgi:hypothetical protein
MKDFLIWRIIYQLSFIGIMTWILVYQCDHSIWQFSNDYQPNKASVVSSVIIATVPIILFVPEHKYCDKK